MRSVLLALALAACAASPAPPSMPAFPGAEGFGADTRGGRGGRVIAVTSLADAGPGSLRAAIEAPGPRTIVFRVAGTIELARELRITHPYITIAGESAPGAGVTLRNHALIVAADEVIIRFLRSRLGDESRTLEDAITLSLGRNIIVDHVSASWSVDETLSVSPPRSAGPAALDKVTVQWSIIAESLDNTAHRGAAHGFGSLVRGSHGARYSFHHNLWAHHRARMPRPGNYQPANIDAEGPLIDFRNNVFYNWAGGRAGYNADTDAVARYNFIANYYLPGPNSASRSLAFHEGSTGARAHFAGNWMDGTEPSDPHGLVRVDVANPHYFLPAPLETAAITTEPADSAYARVLASAGASRVRDSADRRVVASVMSRSGAIIDSQRQVGGWPALAPETPYGDADQDGMSDVWEAGAGLDTRRNDSASDLDGDGYTNIEEFLHSLAGERGETPNR